MTDAPVLVAQIDDETTWKVWCDSCETYHRHGAGEGHRSAHCTNQASPYRTTGYVLRLGAAPTRSRPDEITTLYRLFDAAGQLLYIGIAGNPGRRFEQHRESKLWWSDVATIRLEHHESRTAAAAAERAAIRAELPRHNITHSDRDRSRTVTVPLSHAPVPATEPQVRTPTDPSGTVFASQPDKSPGQRGCPTVPPTGWPEVGRGPRPPEGAGRC